MRGYQGISEAHWALQGVSEAFQGVAEVFLVISGAFRRHPCGFLEVPEGLWSVLGDFRESSKGFPEGVRG